MTRIDGYCLRGALAEGGLGFALDEVEPHRISSRYFFFFILELVMFLQLLLLKDGFMIYVEFFQRIHQSLRNDFLLNDHVNLLLLIIYIYRVSLSNIVMQMFPLHA